jgi:twitching motility protein PilT
MEIPSILVARVLQLAAKKGASSVHLSAGSKPIIRLDGKLEIVQDEQLLTAETLRECVKVLAGEEDAAKLVQTKELVLVKSFENNLRFRINIFLQKNVPSITFSYIPNSLPSLSELGLPKEFIELINLRSGLIIICGPNDSGKTYSAASLLEDINRKQRKYIITLEDPIEYNFVNRECVIEQRQIGRDSISFRQGLELCLEEDLDIAYISDMKDEFGSTLPLILDLAAGNALVILEMRSESVTQSLEKIVNSSSSKNSQEAIRYSLSDVLLGVVCQRLLPKRGGGMVMAAEFLLNNPAAKSLIREGKIFQMAGVIQTSRSEGMFSLKRSVERLVEEEKIERSEAEKLIL